jgi:thioester reductase-like protein
VKALLTGATGLLGGVLLELLLAGGARGALPCTRALSGMDALLHVAGIVYAPAVLEAARLRELGLVRP